MYKGKSFLAIIPARGGSKRIPLKNIKRLGDKPLICWTIEAAKESEVLDSIYVTADDVNIVEVAKNAGAKAPFIRPSSLAQDSSKTADCVAHLMSWVEDEERKKYDFIVLLQPTSPFRTAEHIDAAAAMLIDEVDTDSLISYERVESCDIDGKKHVGVGGCRKCGGQTWKRNGAIYIVSWDVFKAKFSFETDKTMIFEMGHKESLDIDTPEDWVHAEQYLEEVR